MKTKSRPRRGLLSAVRSRHGNAVLALVLDFQFVEEGLRRYLESAFAIIRERTAGVLPCKLNRKQVEKFSLGSLIDEFEKYSDDATLVRDLRDLVPQRNYCAHRAFLEIVFAERAPAAEHDAEASRLLEIRRRLRSAGDRLMVHIRSARALR